MTRAEKVAAIEEALRRWPDLTQRGRAARLGMTYGAYRNLLADPDGSKQAARRLRYRGRCERCGNPTDGSNGPKRVPRHCKRCAAEILHEKRVWTREAVIEAIQRWAQVYGRPPTASDWKDSKTGPRHPALGSVYRSASSPGAPFASWAEAIEAAGFPRPVRGWWRDDSQRAATINSCLRANPEWGLGRVERQLLVHLREDGEATRQELLLLLERPATLGSSLHGLLKRGLIVRLGRGRYRAVAGAEESAAASSL